MYSRSVSSFCVELSSCRVGGCGVEPPPGFQLEMKKSNRNPTKMPWRIMGRRMHAYAGHLLKRYFKL